MMDKKQKLLIAAVLLLAFAAVKIGALWWWQGRQAETQEVACADIRQGCTLPDGSVLVFGGTLGVKTPFSVLLDSPKTEKASLSFAMRDMDMGFNRYDLQRQNGKWALENVRLPLCTEARHDFIADIALDGKVYRVPFRAP